MHLEIKLKPWSDNLCHLCPVFLHFYSSLVRVDVAMFGIDIGSSLVVALLLLLVAAMVIWKCRSTK